MADALAVAEWTKFCKKHNPEDPGLADALKDYAKAKDQEPDEQIEAITEVVKVAESAKKANGKNKEVTGYLNDVLADARKALAVAEAAAEKGDEPEGILGDEALYKKYLKRMLMKLTKAPMSFAIGLGARPEDHRILIHPSKAGKVLFATLKKETDLKKFTYGIAGAHAEKKGVLTFGLEATQISGLKKKSELLLKYYKPLPFDTVMLMVDGEEVQDIPDPQDVEGAPASPTSKEPASPTSKEPAPSGTIPESPPTKPETTTDPNVLVALKAQLAEALKQLKPQIDKAINADQNRKTELFAAMAKVAGQIKEGLIPEARTGIVALGKLVQDMLAKPTQAGPTDADKLKERFETLRDGLEEKFNAARRANPEKSNALLNLWNFAIDQAEDENFTSAIGALDKLKGVIDKLPTEGTKKAEPVTPAEPVAPAEPAMLEKAVEQLREAAEAWQEARETVDDQISQLQKALKETEDDELVEISRYGVNGISGNFKVKLMASMRELRTAQGAALKAAATKTLPLANGFSEHLDSEPRVAACDANPFGVKVSIQKTLGGATSQLAKALEAVINA